MPDLTRITELYGIPLTAQNDGQTVVAGEGFCYLPSGRRMMSAGATQVVSASQAVGWLHAYGYEASNNTLGLELSATAPDTAYRGTARTKTGDASRRYLGSGRIEAVGKLRGGRHVSVGTRGNYILLDYSTASFQTPPMAFNLSITLLTAPTQQTIDLTPFIPPTASVVELKVSNLSNLTTYIGRPTMGTLSRNNRAIDVAPNNNLTFRLRLDSDQAMTILASTTGLLGNVVSLAAGNVVVEVVGYFFDW
ncbi:hypothetical protein [Xanthomonas hortorum]|uniref:Uncharacterized protein n=2 Tax=Xanthomonas hortorum TaxID=56454 RepID=A0A9X4BRP3_9XANT|nr:hypothetical protein [Xanthomonas hortorum]MCE4372072.1 hypothetical protein [Xanthomonas hortorum pv. hederae]MDC8638342.1 hypothetical protein [Xanthomonas hortorum pv. hederae]PPU77438.1 hypothetical protein XhhCFBP4925_19095 [Xanthomonas hortorum pv. hederae]PUE99369.1 hypothetical protein C7T87_14400 [Xanthomonas hortorum pv. hederae]